MVTAVVVVAGVIIAPTAVMLLGIIASIVQAIVIGMVLCAGIAVGGWVAKEVIKEVVFNRQTERIVRAIEQQKQQQQQQLLAPPVQRLAIAHVHVTPTPIEQVRSMQFRNDG